MSSGAIRASRSLELSTSYSRDLDSPTPLSTKRTSELSPASAEEGANCPANRARSGRPERTPRGGSEDALVQSDRASWCVACTRHRPQSQCRRDGERFNLTFDDEGATHPPKVIRGTAAHLDSGDERPI